MGRYGKTPTRSKGQRDRGSLDKGSGTGFGAGSGGAPATRRSSGNIPTRKSPSWRGTLDDGSGRGFGPGTTRGGNVPDTSSQPKRAGYAGSRTVNQHTDTPMSIQEVGKSKFTGLSSGGESSRINTGELDCGDGTGFGGKRP